MHSLSTDLFNALLTYEVGSAVGLFKYSCLPLTSDDHFLLFSRSSFQSTTMISITLITLAALAFGPAEALWPAPKKATMGNSVLFIDQTIGVTYNGDPVCLEASQSCRAVALY